MVVHIVGKVFQAPVDDSYCLLQKLIGSLIGSHYFLPVPLVDIDRVYVVEFFIPSDGIHIGIETASRFRTVFSECHPLPLRE